MSISENLNFIHGSIPPHVRLVAVSKTRTPAEIMEAYNAGQRLFGENKVQEITRKWQELPKEIEWHFIGHLQSNKVRQLVPFVSLIHGVESLKLLSAINREAEKCNRKVSVLLEFHIAREESKFGLSTGEAEELLSSGEFKSMQNIIVAGVMGMATFTEDENQVRSEFSQLKSIFELLKIKYFSNSPQFCEISMGMSDDYAIAVAEGSTMVRIGSKIFGSRTLK